MAERIRPVILSGGAGTRLWPASRNSLPKQFLKLIGPHSTLQETVKRVSDTGLFEKPIIVTAAIVGFAVAPIGAPARFLLGCRFRADRIAAGTLRGRPLHQRRRDGVGRRVVGDRLHAPARRPEARRAVNGLTPRQRSSRHRPSASCAGRSEIENRTLSAFAACA